MTDLVEEAIRVLRRLPESMQETAARAIIDFAAEQEQDLLSQ
jgi:hypothetical protein